MNKIFCLGLGKLGLIFSHILAEYNYKIFGYDIDQNIENKILKNIKDPEPLLNKLINENRKKFLFEKNFKKNIESTDGIFIILPTPSKKNHEFDNSYIYSAINKIGLFLKKKKNYLINITSTVNPGSCNQFINFLEKKFDLTHGNEFILTYNPHLIALGSIYNDVINSDLVIVGSDLKYGHIILKKFYKRIYKKNIHKLKFLNLKEAEISKIAINSFVTMKISYSNTLSQISDYEKNIDVSKILDTVGFDKRVGHKYLSLGGLFSGPCFPRDNLNFAKYLSKIHAENVIPRSIDRVNNIQLSRYLKIYNKFKKNLKKKPKIGICGITYKDNTSLTTKSPGEQLYNYFKKKNKIYIFETNKVNDKKYVIEDNISTFFKKTDIIFVCYKNKIFNKLSNIKTNKKKIIIDLWNYINTKNKKVIVKKIGVN
jgi:UDPglucose 6-dehydrogenase